MLVNGEDTVTDDEPEIPGAGEPEELPEHPTVRQALEHAWDKHSEEPAHDDQPGRDRHERQDRRAAPTRDSAKPEAKDGTPPGAPSTSESAPPNGWSNEAKTAWAQCPDAIKAAVTKRETEMAAGAKQLQERYGGIHQIVQSTAPIAQKYNLTPDKVFANAVSWLQAVEANPAAALKELAKVYKVDLGSTPTGSTTPPNQNPADPRVEQALQRIATIESSETARQQSATNEALASWAKGKPHFESVRSLMAQRIAGAQASNDASIFDANGRIDLDRLYEEACWANPTVRALLQKEAAKAKSDAAKAEATKSRRAATSLKPGTPGARPGTQAPKRGESVRDTINRVVEELRD